MIVDGARRISRHREKRDGRGAFSSMVRLARRKTGREWDGVRKAEGKERQTERERTSNSPNVTVMTTASLALPMPPTRIEITSSRTEFQSGRSADVSLARKSERRRVHVRKSTATAFGKSRCRIHRARLWLNTTTVRLCSSGARIEFLSDK